jgi:hypothetical protein
MPIDPKTGYPARPKDFKDPDYRMEWHHNLALRMAEDKPVEPVRKRRDSLDSLESGSQESG